MLIECWFCDCRGSLYRLLHRPNRELDERRRLRMALDVVSFRPDLFEILVLVSWKIGNSWDLVNKNYIAYLFTSNFLDFWEKPFLAS